MLDSQHQTLQHPSNIKIIPQPAEATSQMSPLSHLMRHKLCHLNRPVNSPDQQDLLQNEPDHHNLRSTPETLCKDLSWCLTKAGSRIAAPQLPTEPPTRLSAFRDSGPDSKKDIAVLGLWDFSAFCTTLKEACLHFFRGSLGGSNCHHQDPICWKGIRRSWPGNNMSTPIPTVGTTRGDPVAAAP